MEVKVVSVFATRDGLTTLEAQDTDGGRYIFTLSGVYAVGDVIRVGESKDDI